MANLLTLRLSVLMLLDSRSMRHIFCPGSAGSQ
jgi:hypothetical protein